MLHPVIWCTDQRVSKPNPGSSYICAVKCEINIIIHCITQIILIIYDSISILVYLWNTGAHMRDWYVYLISIHRVCVTLRCESLRSALWCLIYMVWISQTSTDLLLTQAQLWWEGEQNKRGGWGRVCHVICVTEPQDVTAHHAVRHWNTYKHGLHINTGSFIVLKLITCAVNADSSRGKIIKS